MIILKVENYFQLETRDYFILQRKQREEQSSMMA